MAVTVKTVTRGTAVTVFAAFTKPTRSTYPDVAQIAADPDTVTVTWRWSNGTKTTWTYGVGTHIAKLSTGVYVCTIPTRTPTSNAILGVVTGTGAVTAVGQFQITVTPV